MRIVPVIVGGLTLSLGNECEHGVSLYMQASRAFRRLLFEQIEVSPECISPGGELRGLLPVLASRSIPHESLVHEIGDGAEWARRAKGAAFSVPCSLTGRTPTQCAVARFDERLRIWCDVNRFIATDAQTYTRVVTTKTKQRHSSLAPDLRACLEDFS